MDYDDLQIFVFEVVLTKKETVNPVVFSNKGTVFSHQMLLSILQGSKSASLGKNSQRKLLQHENVLEPEPVNLRQSMM